QTCALPISRLSSTSCASRFRTLNREIYMAGERDGETLKRRGLMLVLSSPSGAGKTTISRALLQEDHNLVMSVSATTRPPRPGEIEGKDYTSELQSRENLVCRLLL